MRTILSRLLLVGFLGVAVVAVVHLSSGSGGGLVDFERIDPGSLSHEAFTLGQPGTFAIHAVGSFEEGGSPASDTTLAAYGWIVRRDDGAVVWQMRPARPERGTLAGLRDTLALDPGTYDAYFTSHGDPVVRVEGPRSDSFGERVRAFLSRGGRSWVGDAGRWRFGVQALDAGAREATDADQSDPARALDAAADSSVVWQALGVRDRSKREALIEVTASAPVELRAVTEIIDGTVADRASIVRLGQPDTVWTASGPGVWAGGSVKNREVTATITLDPGLYRVAFEADRSHAYRDWTANPPFRPWEWGLSVRRGDSTDAVRVLDTADLDLPRLLAVECVGSDAERVVEFDLAEPTDVLVVTVGEQVGGSEYDFAVIDEREDDGDWDEIWEMDDADLTWAGGADKNKRAVVALSLDPGTYRMVYETDGSHDCESGYNDGGGPVEPLWGAIVYLLDPEADPASYPVRDLGPGQLRDLPSSDGLPSAMGQAGRGTLVAEIAQARDDEDRRVPFEVPEGATVVVEAHGELSPSDPFDYATIERPNGSVVWEQTWRNTVPGGSEYYFRRFEGAVDLAPGDYVLRYRTDGSRAAGDFGALSRDLWGARVWIAEPTPDVPAPPPAAPPRADSLATSPPPPAPPASDA